MTPGVSPSLAADPFAFMIVLVVRRRDDVLTPALSPAETHAVALQIAERCHAQIRAPGVTLAVLGQPYGAEQLCGTRLLTDFARHARRLVAKALGDGKHPLVLPVAGESRAPFLPVPYAPPRDPTEAPRARGGFVRIVGIPCALVGKSSTLATPTLPTLSRPLPCPALTACVSQMLAVEAAQVVFFTLQRPATMAQWVTEARGHVRGSGDLADAKLHAQRRTAPVCATAAGYGAAGTLEYLTLAIADAATQQVLRVYRYHASDFPGRGEEADAFFQKLSFAWGAVDYTLLPTLQPVRCDAAGTLLPYERPVVTAPPGRSIAPGEKSH